MFNKKGAGAIQQLPGIFMVTIAIMLMLLFFWSCSANREAKRTNEFEFSKNEIEAIKALNFFLEMPIGEECVSEDRTVMDTIIEGDYDCLNTMAVGHFGELDSGCDDYYWHLTIDGGRKYNSNRESGHTDCACISGTPAEIEIPFLDEGLEVEEVKVFLFTTKYCH